VSVKIVDFSCVICIHIQQGHRQSAGKKMVEVKWKGQLEKTYIFNLKWQIYLLKRNQIVYNQWKFLLAPPFYRTKNLRISKNLLNYINWLQDSGYQILVWKIKNLKIIFEDSGKLFYKSTEIFFSNFMFPIILSDETKSYLLRGEKPQMRYFLVNSIKKNWKLGKFF
jgi:hypothetical protein